MSRGDGSTWPGRAVAAVVGATLAVAALWTSFCLLMLLVRPHGELLNGAICAGVGAGFALIALWLCLILRRLGVMGGTSDGTDGEGWGRVPHGPNSPQPPSDEPDLWPEFERELRAYLEEHERAPVAG